MPDAPHVKFNANPALLSDSEKIGWLAEHVFPHGKASLSEAITLCESCLSDSEQKRYVENAVIMASNVAYAQGNNDPDAAHRFYRSLLTLSAMDRFFSLYWAKHGQSV